MLAYFEMGTYPLQISWLVRTVKYWNNTVADTTNDHNRAMAHLICHPIWQSIPRLCCTQHARHFARASHNSLLHTLCLTGRVWPTANAASMHSGCCSVDCRPTMLTCPGQRISMLTCLLSRSMQLRERAWAAAPSDLCLPTHQPTSTYPQRIFRRCNRGVDDD
jgi:hypothetical protein